MPSESSSHSVGSVASKHAGHSNGIHIGKNHMGMSVMLCCCKTPFFQLTKKQMRDANNALHREVYKFFTEEVRAKWADLRDVPKPFKGAHLAPERVFDYMRRLINRDLEPAKDPKGLALTSSSTPPPPPPPTDPEPEDPTYDLKEWDHGCWVCFMVGGQHYCRPCAQLYKEGAPVMVSVDTPAGKITVGVMVEMVLLDEHVDPIGVANGGHGHSEHEHEDDDEEIASSRLIGADAILTPAPRGDGKLVGGPIASPTDGHPGH